MTNANAMMTRTPGTKIKMAHRQSGGYKEEPGVAVAGDHVSTQFFFCESM
jgi:hypothetical protein